MRKYTIASFTQSAVTLRCDDDLADRELSNASDKSGVYRLTRFGRGKSCRTSHLRYPEPPSNPDFFNTINLFQLKLAEAGGEVARFGINTTVGVVGLFDPADKWFGLKEHPNDFGLTIRYYNLPTGPYVMLPFFGPSTVGDTVGLVADGAMDPVSYFVPWYVSIAVAGGQRAIEAVNYRSLNLNQFEEADRYAIDLYGAVQDAYLQTRDHEVKKLHEEQW